MKNLTLTILQVLFFLGIAKLSDACVAWLHLPVPGSVFGIFLLFVLLKSRIVRLDWIAAGSKWLLAEMLLFFVPAAVGIVNYKTLIVHNGLWMLLTIAGSLLTVMALTGLLGEWISRRTGRHAG
ncbi:CidA/LrgA family protein [Paenibacillus oryzisoli]|uniref:CidA/LrgA family protein n=1 Tax=Paenibacillus oryzisoli TaxID=1850517 RepID=UPI003D270601